MVFGWLLRKSGPQAIEKHAKRVADKNAQAPDRWDSIQAIESIMKDAKARGDKETVQTAVRALLARFTFYTDPTITDEEEKEYAFQVIVQAGPDAIDPIRSHMSRCESLVWPIKLLDRLLPREDVVSVLLETLNGMDTEYQRDPQKKLQLLQALEERRDGRIANQILRFLDDVNESVRFHAISTLLHQENVDEFKDQLLAHFVREESLRIKHTLLEHFSSRKWSLPSGLASALPPGWKLDPNGHPTKS